MTKYIIKFFIQLILLVVVVNNSHSDPLTVDSSNLFGQIWPPNTSKLHTGVDFNVGTSANKKVYFNESGIVKNIHLDSQGWGYGILIVPHSRPDSTYVIWHLNLPDVTEGQIIDAGTQLGTVKVLNYGSIVGGNSHIHLGFRNAPYNASNYLRSMAGALYPASFPDSFENPPNWDIISLDNPLSNVSAILSGSLISSGTIKILGNGFGSLDSPGKVVVTINNTESMTPLFKQKYPYQSSASDRTIQFNASVPNGGWSDKSISVNIFNDVLKWENFNSPVIISVYKNDNTKVGELSYPFKDVIASDWSQCHIQQLWKKGVVTGKSSTDLFAKEDRISRSEFLGMAMKAVKTVSYPSPTQNPFPDVPKDSWYASYVEKAKNLPLVEGGGVGNVISGQDFDVYGISCLRMGGVTGDKCFFPRTEITRLQAANILAGILGITPDTAIPPPWGDYSLDMGLGPWALFTHKGTGDCGEEKPVAKGYQQLVFGTANSFFLTRQEASAMINIGRTVKESINNAKARGL